MNAVHLCVVAPLGQTEALAWLDLHNVIGVHDIELSGTVSAAGFGS